MKALEKASGVKIITSNYFCHSQEWTLMFKVAEISWYATTQQLLQGWLGLNWLIELSRLLLRSKFHYKPQMSGVTALKMTRDSSSCWKPLSWKTSDNVWKSKRHLCCMFVLVFTICMYIHMHPVFICKIFSRCHPWKTNWRCVRVITASV